MYPLPAIGTALDDIRGFMQKRPSNWLLYVVIGIIAILGIYVAGSLILEARQEIPEASESFE